MRINTNVSSLNTLKTLGSTGKAYEKSVGRLSSGFRINHASDDAAGLGIANKLRADIRSLRQASRNAEQATSLLQVAEGATSTVASIVDRMKELSTQAASDNVDDAGRGRIKAEYDALKTEIQKIADTTKFQGKALINGAFGNSVDTNVANSTSLDAGTGLYSVDINGTVADTYDFTQGADGDLTVTNQSGVSQTISGVAAGKQDVTFSTFGLTLHLTADFDETAAAGTLDGTALVVDAGSAGGSFLVRSSGAYSSDDLVSLENLDLTTGASGLNLDALTFTGNGTAGEWQTALTQLDSAIGSVNSVIGSIGAAQNRIEYAMQNTDTAVVNFAAAESVIRDVDMAAEVTEMTKYQILQQAGTAMLAQANSAPQGVLSLLR